MKPDHAMPYVTPFLLELRPAITLRETIEELKS